MIVQIFTSKTLDTKMPSCFASYQLSQYSTRLYHEKPSLRNMVWHTQRNWNWI